MNELYMNELRSLPSVEKLLQSSSGQGWVKQFGRPLVLEAVRHSLEAVRIQVASGEKVLSASELEREIENRLAGWIAPTLLPVINASGVVLHTNLGRAPLSQAALWATYQVGQGYSTLEYDLLKGKRGSRLVHAESLLTKLTGAEAAMVVNNNAAAVLLVLTALARRRTVLIARSQLVEIGGGFRVPDVMKQSGARLLEIGTTNRVHLSDYQQALQEKPALVMWTHRSNFVIVGFTSEPGLAEVAQVTHQAGLPLVYDLGSGTLLDTARFGLAHEPMVQESLAAGADLVCFSGDKLLGGPQAGIIIGKKELLSKLKNHPLARAIRPDKLCLAALSATLLHYLKDEAETEIPVWRMISTSPDLLRRRVEAWQARLGCGSIIAGQSTIGGGSLPGETLSTSLLALPAASSNRFLQRLRQADPPIIARLQDDLVLLDPRTVLPEQEDQLLNALVRLFQTEPKKESKK
jgi:L-seryl-tRNA(Ser) seleniumtransferase